MGLKAAVQALKKAEELKARVSQHNDLLNNSEVWSDQQQLQTVYHQVLVLDLEYALDKKVEQELWTLGFKNHIGALQHLSKDKKNPKRSEYQALLSWCLEAASGFYLTLLQELCSTFELDLPFRRRNAVYGQTKSLSSTTLSSINIPDSEQFTQPHKSSCLYICQYCLVHLGDIARYRSQRKQAESFYRHAILLSPSSGQPYNQLALLEASRGDRLATVFHYVRSICIKHPFPAAATNLSKTLSAVIDHDELFTETHSKLSLMEFLTIFLRVHGLLHLATDLDQAELCVKNLNDTFTALIATNAFSSMKLIQMTAINLYALRYALDSFSSENLSADELRVKNLILDLLAGAFSAYLLPIYTMPNDSTLLDYCALPAIKLTLDWIKINSKVLNENVFTKRLQIWPSLCKLLNVLQTISEDTMCTKNSEKIPLPEDRDLQCFLPLLNTFKELDFTSYMNSNYDFIFFNNLRVTRLVNLSVWLATQSMDNTIFITAKKVKNSSKVIFEPCIKQPDPTTELLEELKHFNIKETKNIAVELQKTPVKVEKRTGILKPQGSLEKAREEREQQHQNLILSSNIKVYNTDEMNQLDESNILPLMNNMDSLITSLRSSTCTTVNNVIADSSKLKRNRQNIAMQVLAKKVNEENNNKQVTFVTEPFLKHKENNQVQQQTSLQFHNKIQYNDSPNSLTAKKNIINKSNHIENIFVQKMPNAGGSLNNDIQQQCSNNNSYQNQIHQLLAYKQQQQQVNMALTPSSLYSTTSNSVIGTNMYHPSTMQHQSSSIAASVTYNPRQYSNTFDLNSIPVHLQQSQSYHSLLSQQHSEHLFPVNSSWLHDDNKLPMPPSTWTSWPQQYPVTAPPPTAAVVPSTPPPPPPPLPLPSAPPTSSLSISLNSQQQQSNIVDLFSQTNNSNYSYQSITGNKPCSSSSNNQSGCLNNFIKENLNTTLSNNHLNDNNIINRYQYNNKNSNIPATSLNNSNNTMSLWNSGPNLQMIFNHYPSTTKSNSVKQTSFTVTDPTMLAAEKHQQTNASISSGGYSLFNSNWAPNLTGHSTNGSSYSPPDRTSSLMRQQSLFSGPGPSPLERLLQQQKQQRGSNITSAKEDT